MSDLKAILNTDSTIKSVFSDGLTVIAGNTVPITLLVGSRDGAYTLPITNYSMTVNTRTGQITVFVN
jgi:hypothetical protein